MVFMINIPEAHIMTDNLFFCTGVSPTDILDKLYQEASVESNYYWSPAKDPVLRCDVSLDLRKYFQELIKVPFRDCGFLVTKPNTVYPIHVDWFRKSALNMLMVDDHPDFKTIIIEKVDNRQEEHTVNYVKNEFTLLNVGKVHGVRNNSNSLTRIMLSIGFHIHDYDTVLGLHRENKLFNV